MGTFTPAQDTKLLEEAEKAMLAPTRYMVEEVCANGGYVSTPAFIENMNRLINFILDERKKKRLSGSIRCNKVPLLPGIYSHYL